MRGQSLDLILDFRRNAFEEIRRRRIEIAGKHEILPDHQAKPIAEVVEPVRLVETTAPDSDHVHIRVNGGLKQILDPFRADARHERIGGDPVGTTAEDLAAIDAERKTAAGFVRIGQEFNAAEADLARDALA